MVNNKQLPERVKKMEYHLNTEKTEKEILAVTGDETQNQKHDEGYKNVFSNKEIFLYFLRKYIAKPWTANISADDLAQVNKSFITREYRHIDSDLIYKLKIGGTDVYFYVLIELQSQVDFTMPFRLLRYMVELLNDIFKNTDEKIRERKDFRLPAIVPIVFYNGDDKWTQVMTYGEYTEDYEIFGDNIINFRYLMFDLKRADKSTILPVRKLLDAVFSLDKRRLEKKLSPEEVMVCLTEQTPELSDEDKNALVDWIIYILYKGKVSPDMRDTLKNLLNKGEKTVMKHALEVWRDEYIDEQLRGREKQKALEIARTMKDKGMDVNTIVEITKLTVDDVLRL